MKIRNGFVSNSSSSSFVILGVKQPDFDPEMEDKLPKGIDALYVEYKDCDYVVGSIIADSEELDDISLSFSELEEEVKKVAEFLNVDVSEVKLMIGTRYC